MLDDALAAYRGSFRPSPQLDAPYTMLGVSVVCGESDEHARWLAAPGALAFLRLRQGRPDVYPTPDEAAEYRFTPFERQQVDAWTASHVIGGAESVRAHLEALVERTGVDELMVTTMVHAHDERVASYERLAGVFALSATH
jgi:alkanesulfonate monooxygenase SsuD/methylene tetrahydromethanopterin reductase-like flavin-dependent oxidoreductase (luciferase family)